MGLRGDAPFRGLFSSPATQLFGQENRGAQSLQGLAGKLEAWGLAGVRFAQDRAAGGGDGARVTFFFWALPGYFDPQGWFPKFGDVFRSGWGVGRRPKSGSSRVDPRMAGGGYPKKIPSFPGFPGI